MQNSINTNDYNPIPLPTNRPAYATIAQVIQMSSSVGITFVATIVWPSARWSNVFVTTCVDMCACMNVHIFTYLSACWQ